MANTKRLTHSSLEALRKKGAPGKHADGDGLYVRIRPNGGMSWQGKYRLGGREKTASYGTYPQVGIAEARQRHAEARELLRKMIDPCQAKREKKRRLASTRERTFKKVAEDWLDRQRNKGNTHGYTSKIVGCFALHVYPEIGDKDIGLLDGTDVLRTMEKIEAKKAFETARRALRWCKAVFDFAIDTTQISSNPCNRLQQYLKPPVVKHMAALTDPRKLGEFLRAADGYGGSIVVRAALRLLPHLMVRPNELRFARWEEIDLENACWTIPAARMKGTFRDKQNGKPHVVPLATQAVALLQELQSVVGAQGLVFRGERSAERPISDNTLNAAIRAMGYSTKNDVTSHGFRATARTLLVEELAFRTEVVEAQLAHAVKDANGRAYNRTEFLKERTLMMQAWADYLQRVRTGGTVVQLLSTTEIAA